MASKLLFLPLVSSALLALGCNPPDPVWALACDERPEREVIPGTGIGGFVPATDAPVPVVNGSQGGQHIWFGVRLRGFGPEAVVDFGIHDAADPALEYSSSNSEFVRLVYNAAEEASEASGLFAFIYGFNPDTQMELPSPSGKSVVFWANVTDKCPATAVRGETVAEIR